MAPNPQKNTLWLNQHLQLWLTLSLIVYQIPNLLIAAKKSCLFNSEEQFENVGVAGRRVAGVSSRCDEIWDWPQRADVPVSAVIHIPVLPEGRPTLQFLSGLLHSTTTSSQHLQIRAASGYAASDLHTHEITSAGPPKWGKELQACYPSLCLCCVCFCWCVCVVCIWCVCGVCVLMCAKGWGNE